MKAKIQNLNSDKAPGAEKGKTIGLVVVVVVVVVRLVTAMEAFVVVVVAVVTILSITKRYCGCGFNIANKCILGGEDSYGNVYQEQVAQFFC